MGVEPTPDRVAAIVQLKQFGKLFEKSTIHRLPIPLEQDFFEWNGLHYAIVQADVDWQDPAGLWKLVILQETRSWLAPSQRLVVDLSIGVGVWLLLLLVRLRRHAHRTEQRNQAALQAIHRKLEVHASQLEAVVQERTQALRNSQEKLENLIQTGLDLGQESDRMMLLRKILFGARDLLHCDVGTLYLLTEQKTLRFTLRTNTEELPSFEIPLYDAHGVPVERFISTWCALHNTPVIIDDIYQESHFDVSGTKNFDARSGYRTVSMLTVPLAPREGKVIGVLQFLNALDPKSGQVTTFHPELVRFVTAMAAQAGVALDNHQLIEAQRELMEALIKLIAGAIDTKSPYTGGHCERVPELGILLAEEASRATEGELADFGFASEEEWREFRIGAWLHDCGKVTTPEYVVDKATKLETLYNRIHEIRTRFEVLLRDAMIERLEAVAAGVEAAQAEARFARRKAQLVDDFAFIAQCNLGDSPMTPADRERLQRIAAETWQRHFDDHIGQSHGELSRHGAESAPVPVTEHLLADKPEHIIARTEQGVSDPKYGFKIKIPEHLYNYGEIYNLSIGRGTLTEEERYKINEHVIQTIIMLEQLPLPPNLRRVPEYAGSHHETLIGTGYPRKLGKEELSIPSRIMAIADIFEALTASDRPYKLPKKLSEAVKILYFFKKDGHIDPALFDLFLRSGVYRRYGEKYLRPEQLDEVDIQPYLS
ncbi:MAG: GAF domain-containing protein [Magnetococcales bacterium]|nr:GAF domain-containing protein [Magnetococcales bacterium]